LQFFDVDDRLERLSDLGDHLEAFRTAVDFEMFRPDLDAALAYSDGAQGGRPPFDPVMTFKVLVIQAIDNLSDERAEFLVNDRLSLMRFLGLGLSDRIPDARTIWLFREKLTKAGAIGPLFERFDATLRQSGYIAMSGQIVDAIDVGFGFIRKWAATDAAAYDGAQLCNGLLDKTHTAAGVWADTAYRSAANEAFMEKRGFTSHIHRKKPKGKSMPDAIRRANAAKSKIRSRVEHVFAEQKDRMKLFIRTVGIARAAMKIRMTNLVYNIKRLVFLCRTAAA
jgi:IS5 family transposase